MKFVTKKFILSLLSLFDSTEPREREYVKNLYHRLYGKLMVKRKTFRKTIGFILSTLVHENYLFHGMPELLDLLASIISGFAVPLREEHISFFKQTFIPLHKVQTSNLFHEQLQRCTMLFLTKVHQIKQYHTINAKMISCDEKAWIIIIIISLISKRCQNYQCLQFNRYWNTGHSPIHRKNFYSWMSF